MQEHVVKEMSSEVICLTGFYYHPLVATSAHMMYIIILYLKVE